MSHVLSYEGVSEVQAGPPVLFNAQEPDGFGESAYRIAQDLVEWVQWQSFGLGWRPENPPPLPCEDNALRGTASMRIAFPIRRLRFLSDVSHRLSRGLSIRYL